MNFDIIKQHINPDSVLDIGSNAGHWYQESKTHWPDARFMMIEGNPECYDMLSASGGRFRMALLSDTEKDVTFYTRKGAPACTGASYNRELTQFYEGDNAVPNTIATRKLDDILDGETFELIKIDVQGAEIDVMRGGLNTLAAAEAVILEVSIVEYNQGSPMADEVDAFMKSIGFVNHVDLGEIVHPISREHIQTDRLYLR